MDIHIKTTNELQDISTTVERVEGILRSYKLKTKELLKATLTLEETLVRISELTTGEIVPIQITINKGLRNTYLKISYKGAPLHTDDLYSHSTKDVDLSNYYDIEEESVVRDIVLRANAELLTSKYSHGVNTIKLLVSTSDKKMLYDTLTALVVGFIVGIITRNIADAELTAWISHNFFLPFYQLFLTLITMVIAPFIFFSLTNGIAGFQDLSVLGRTGSKIMGSYLLTTFICIMLCISFFYLFQPGLGTTIALPHSLNDHTDVISLSLMGKIMDIVPDNFFGAFVKNDMLNIMFLAILIGAVMGKTGKYAEKLKYCFESLNELFSKLTSVLSALLPIAIFGSTANMAATLNLDTVGPICSWFGFVLFCSMAQLLVYLLLLVILGRINPLPFIQKFFPAMMTAFVTSSSSVAIPTSQECCQRMGISPRIFSFSIPLGANVNMDGTSILFCGTTLFLANLYGIAIPSDTMVSLVVSVMLISVALPGVPGAGTACMLMLFSIVGIPAEAYGIVIGLCPLLELFETMVNVTGDGVVTTIVAHSENSLDMNSYNTPS